MVAGIGAGRHDQIADGHVGRLAVGTQSDGEDGNLRFLGQLDGGVGRDAGVLPAVAEDDDARDGLAPLRLDQLPQGLAEPRFDAGGGQQFGPIGRRVETSLSLWERVRVRAAGVG